MKTVLRSLSIEMMPMVPKLKLFWDIQDEGGITMTLDMISENGSFLCFVHSILKAEAKYGSWMWKKRVVDILHSGDFADEIDHICKKKRTFIHKYM